MSFLQLKSMEGHHLI
uniref:Uncharacterized protein n=1 Tax=Arundo donax TaxID=35708 RepID=A0A0A8YS43_ARUDO